MPWESSGSTPFNAMQWAKNISDLGEQMQDRQDKISSDGKAADAFFKDESRLQAAGVDPSVYKNMGAVQKAGLMHGMISRQAYDTGATDMAKAQAITTHLNQQTAMEQQEAARRAKMPAFINGMLSAQGAGGADPANDIPYGNGPTAEATPTEMLKAGMKVAPDVFDDKMFGEALHYVLNDRANAKSYDEKPEIVPLNANWDAVRMKGSKEYQIVAHMNGPVSTTTLPNGQEGTINPKSGVFKPLPIPKTDWHDLTTQQKKQMDEEYKALENDSIYNAGAFGATPEDRVKAVSARREDLDHKYQKMAEANRKSVKPTQPTVKDILEIQSDEDYVKLPSGTKFKGPDGKTRIKP